MGLNEVILFSIYDLNLQAMKLVQDLITIETNFEPLLQVAQQKQGGLLKLARCWVTISFLQLNSG